MHFVCDIIVSALKYIDQKCLIFRKQAEKWKTYYPFYQERSSKKG